MKRAIVAAAASLLLSAPVSAQPYGPGPGMMEEGYGAGPGYGWGYGPGSGMGGRWGWGPGPGVMGRGGPGMGPGMMGYGPGPGMMGWGGYGYGYFGIPDLTAEQRAQLAQIQEETQRKQWALMQSMHELAWQQRDAYRGGTLNEEAARQHYEAMAKLRKQMFENGLEARKRMEGVLTPEQRDRLAKARSNR